MEPHRMHLRGPWEYEWLSDDDATDALLNAAPGESASRRDRHHLPADWQSLFADRAGTVRFLRRFHCPTNLESHERVFIVFDGIRGSGQVGLNGDILGAIDLDTPQAEFDVTSQLKPANELTVELSFDPAKDTDQPGGLWKPVALEIRFQ